MNLSPFITEHLDEIVREWEDFARTLQPATAKMSGAELRDHAKKILQAIAEDIQTPESAKQQKEKSKGEAAAGDKHSAASRHGALRQLSGFTMPQLTAEFRAMRACVLRLWLPHIKQVSKETSHDMLRFNEAIDQALQESAVTFSEQTARTRDTFLAMLGHDLRSPLATMTMAGNFLTRPNEGSERTLAIGARVKRSAASMTTMVNDLLEYTRSQLGGAMPIRLALADMQEICQAALDDASAAHPECAFELKVSGDLMGDFDSARLQQVFSNLLNNAAQYCARNHPVTMLADGKDGMLSVRVKNHGPDIPAASLTAIFDPMVQLAVDAQQKGRAPTSLGLGLFIAREITVAHGGTITVESGSGTVFTVSLPRTQAC